MQSGIAVSKPDTHGVESRQKAFQVFKDALGKLEVCASCAASGLLYVAVSLAQQRMRIGWDEFVRVAKEIWDDAEKQRANKQLVGPN